MKKQAVAILFFGLLVPAFLAANSRGVASATLPIAATPTPQPNMLPTTTSSHWWFLNTGQGMDQLAGLPESGAIRGIPGDMWADIVIGQPDFSQITPNEVVGNKLFNPGGVYVDRSVQPNRVYVYDAGNSRILGFLYLGTAQGGPEDGQPCTSNSDHPNSICIIDSTRYADIVIGQETFNSSACNGDSARQNYPADPLPSSSTICGMRPMSVSTLEAGAMATMATDPQGNFYFPDHFNNRVLRYNDPFISDSIADFVWGQSDFTGASCNMGASYGNPTNQSLCLANLPGYGNLRSGVAIDSQGNLWVADTQNNRVIRFPYSASQGVPARTADLVLGQSTFTTAISGTGLDQMSSPTSVRVDPGGNVYVADGGHFGGYPGRILIFHQPLSNGMPADQVLSSGLGEPSGLEFDAEGGLWVNDCNNGRLLRFVQGNLQQTINIPSGTWGGIGIDRDRNVMLTGWEPQEVLVYTPSSYSWTATFLQADTYGSFNHLGPKSFSDSLGLEVTNDQLIISDGTRILFWNSPAQLTNNYPAADGVVGQPDFYTRPRWDGDFGRLRQDNQNRLWVVKSIYGVEARIYAYQLPLQTGAEPIIQIASPLPLQGGGEFSWTNGLYVSGIAFQANCDCLWLSDPDYNRVFRIRNVSSPQRVVDIVLGQKNVSGIHCNQGRDSDDGYAHPIFPSRDSLCRPGGLAFDQDGNLYVSDHNLEVAGNWRMLEYDANTISIMPSTAVFGIPASRVLGRNGDFTEANCLYGDPICGPWEPAFSPMNQSMYVGFNGYLGPRFIAIYQNPLTDSFPIQYLGDFFSHPISIRFDTQANLYVLDLTRHRVLIYKSSSPTFEDVDFGQWALTWIERLYDAGVTSGCGTNSLIYCPEAPATRAQMAIFLERGMNGSGFVPPGGTGLVFGDVPIAYWAVNWIEKLAIDGITSGCGGGNYCPESPTTREQMAIFLLRAKYGSSYSPPPATGTVFGDVPASSIYAAWIEKLAAEGITSGCGGGNYCPENQVTRAQMAVFLVRTFNLP